ncbi:MAG: hypothetical protein LWY06_04265 [Firmicutes bacterium]|nr:hypothetical protein [Bacillota bacterium]
MNNLEASNYCFLYNNRTYFLDCTDADSASLPAIYGLPQYDENFNKTGFIPTSTGEDTGYTYDLLDHLL